MPDTGWKSPSTVTGFWAGGNNWGNPQNAATPTDVNFATWSGSKFNGHNPGDGPALLARNFNFNIPAKAIIVGVEGYVRSGDTGNFAGNVAYLTTYSLRYDGSPLSYGSPPALSEAYTDSWIPPYSSGVGSPQTWGDYIYGGPYTTWGSTLTPDIVNNANFGWNYMVYDDVAPLGLQVSYMQMKIYYKFVSPVITMIGP